MALRFGSGAGAARYPITAWISILLVVVNLMAWVVLLGGASGLQKDAVPVTQLLNSAAVSGDLKPISTTGNFISYEWFKAVFQVLTLLGALGALAIGHFYHSRVALVGLLAALGVFFADSSNTFYALFLSVHNNDQVPSKIRKEVSTYFAGCIMSATLNFLLVISLGTGAGTATAGTSAGTAATTAPGAGVKDAGNGAAPHV